MGERQKEVDDLVRLDGRDAQRHVEHRAVVAVADHAALRRSGGPGGVDEGADVLRADRRVARLPFLGRVRGATRAQLLERDHVVRLALHQHDLLELRELLADRHDLGELLGVLDDHELRVGVLEHVLAFLGRVGLVDRDDDRADAERGEIDVRPFGAGVGQDRDLVALLDPEGDQAEGELRDGLPDLGERAVEPVARRSLEQNGGGVAVEGCRAWQQVGDRAAPGAPFDGGGPAQRACLHGVSAPLVQRSRTRSGSRGGSV